MFVRITLLLNDSCLYNVFSSLPNYNQDHTPRTRKSIRRRLSKRAHQCINWTPTPLDHSPDINNNSSPPPPLSTGMSLTSSNVLYIGDSLFADLVDAKRDFGWTTAAVVPEVAWEIELQRKAKFTNSQHIIDLILDTLRRIQIEMGNGVRTPKDI